MTEPGFAYVKLCSVASCTRNQYAKTYCGRHYQRWRTYADPLGGSREVFKDDAPEGFRTCRRCLVVKPCDEEHFNWANKGGGNFAWASSCRDCEKVRTKTRRESLTPEERHLWNYSPIKTRYKRSAEDYDRVLVEQGGGCASCGKPPTGSRRLSWDHDHSCCSGRTTCGECVRGLLCAYCNVIAAAIENGVADKVTVYLNRWCE